ncbi:MAG: hypothetical protein NDI61_09550 [Bdellovibrionaceae bacterium]|nr:hypothetical protein [Pseudobdellovibrionaceae bacterium]
MKHFSWTTMLIMALTTGTLAGLDFAEAKKNTVKKAASTQSPAPQTTQSLGTDHVFSDARVRGRYQYADDGVVTVENEKELIDLLGVRKHFKDRLDVETTRN